jgi:hypothetical protein
MDVSEEHTASSGLKCAGLGITSGMWVACEEGGHVTQGEG